MRRIVISSTDTTQNAPEEEVDANYYGEADQQYWDAANGVDDPSYQDHEGYYGYNDDEYYDEPEAAPGLFGSRGRVLALVGSLLALVLVAGAVVGLVNSRNSANSLNSYSVVNSNAGAGNLDTAPRVGALAPDFTLQDVDGKTVKLSSYRGKPVWVNFWASWCPPCKAEMPYMKQKYAKYKDQGLVILGVDLREDAPTVKQFVTSNGYDWTFPMDVDGNVAQQYYVSAIPTHVFVGTDGVIKSMQIGGIPEGLMEQRLATILGK